MIVDSSALPEQVTDDVLHSAFGSAGQRCSALRILCVQEDVADEIISMIKGAVDYLHVGDPVHLATDVGPIIDSDAKDRLDNYISELSSKDHSILQSPYNMRLDEYGTFLAPTIIDIETLDDIETEAFGPILHILRFKEKNLDNLIIKLNKKGYGLTFGLHSRIHAKQNRIAGLVNAGNIYINRGQTGAVVGVQPFGGRGLSGTGPKAGGPYYLHAFATEKSISNNITASGGNATLVNL
jgi:RHH-type proline utilization regulon transcriptional repressor/proline dehydrogenase/delta 1-pyrroline-5-carboxylate dehydrogenase